MTSIPSTNSHLHWPANLNDIGVTEETRELIDSLFTHLYSKIKDGEKVTAEFVKTDEKKRFFQIIDRSTKEVLEEYLVPLSLDIRLDDDRIFLISKNTIGKGQERTVKAVHDLRTGTPFVKKEINKENEFEIYQLIQSNPSTGLPQNFHFRRNGSEKLQVLEERLTGPLFEALQKRIFRTDALKLHAVKELAQGLHTLHHFKLESNNPCFHADLKIENILFDKNGNVQWTDFGYSGQVEKLVGSLGYQSPELVAMIAKAFPEGYGTTCAVTAEEIATYYKKHGQPIDIWAFAIVILTILKNADVHPLRAIAGALKRSESHPLFKDFYMQFLKQEELAAEIEAWRIRASPIEQALLDIAERMLQVDPDQRITIDDVLEQVNRI